MAHPLETLAKSAFTRMEEIVTYIHDLQEVTLLDRPGVDTRNETLLRQLRLRPRSLQLTSRSGTLLAQLLNAPPKVGLAMISSTASRLSSAQSLSNGT